MATRHHKRAPCDAEAGSHFERRPELHEILSESGRCEHFWAQACVRAQCPKRSRTAWLECEDALPSKGRALCGPSTKNTVLVVIIEKVAHCAVARAALPCRHSHPWARPLQDLRHSRQCTAFHRIVFASSGEGGPSHSSPKFYRQGSDKDASVEGSMETHSI